MEFSAPLPPRPSAAPVLRPTRDVAHLTHRPTHRHLSPRPTTPTPSPTINYWAHSQGQAAAVSAAVGGVALVLALCAWRRATFRRHDSIRERQKKGQIGEEYFISPMAATLRATLLTSTEGSCEAGPFSKVKVLQPRAVETSALLQSRSSMVAAACFVALMLAHAGCMAYGLVSYWDLVHLGGTFTRTARDGTVTKTGIDSKLYEATFWMNVKEFWDAEAQPVACLIFFSGVVQPLIQLASVSTVAFAPLTTATRHRMLTAQEVTCKIPLSSFFVEAYLLLLFTFNVEFSGADAGASVALHGIISVTGYVGLLLYFVGQLSFLPVINLLRSCHRAREVKVDGEEILAASRRSADANYRGLYSPPPVQHEPLGERRLAETRPFWWRFLMLACSAGALACCSMALRVPFIKFTYTGAFEPYIVVPDSTGGTQSGDGGPLELGVSLHQICAKLLPDLVPVAHAWFYWGSAWMLLVGNPCLLALLAALLALVPDGARRTRRLIGEAAEVLQCWCGAENIAIATVFLSPNLELITSFVFDGSDLCTYGGTIDVDTGDVCLLVKGSLEPKPIAALVAYALLTILLARLSAWELHGGFRREN